MPWVDLEQFLLTTRALALADREQAESDQGWTFFDRSVIDAESGLAHLRGEVLAIRGDSPLRYHRRIFMTPPWPQIYTRDEARRHDLSDAEAEYARLLRDYAALGHQVVLLPKLDVMARVDFVLQSLDA